MKIFFSIISVSMFLILRVTSYSQDTTFIYTYGGSGYDEGRSIQQTTDGGFILAGSTSSGGAGSSDVYLIKIDSLGNFLWSKTYGGTGIEWGYSVKQTFDGGYIIAGYTNSFGAGGYDAYLIKTDSLGDTLWTKTYGGTDWEFAYKVIITPDSGYALVGETYSFGNGNNDVWLIKTDSLGDTLWTRTYGGTNNDIGRSVQNTFDKGFIISGETNSFGIGEKDVYLINTDSLGDTLWTKTYGGDSTDFGNDIIQTLDTTFVVVGATNSTGAGAKDVYLIKIDNDGNILWSRTYGGTKDDEGNSVMQIPSIGFAIVGYTLSFVCAGADKNFFFPLTDNDGWQLMNPAFGGQSDDIGFSFELIGNNEFILVGTTESHGMGYTDILTMKIDTSDDMTNCNIGDFISNINDTTLSIPVGIEEQSQFSQQYQSPKMTASSIDILLDRLSGTGDSDIIIYNLMGQKISSTYIRKSNPLRLDISQLSPGLYFYVIISNNVQIIEGKLIKMND